MRALSCNAYLIVRSHLADTASAYLRARIAHYKLWQRHCVAIRTVQVEVAPVHSGSTALELQAGIPGEGGEEGHHEEGQQMKRETSTAIAFV